MHPWLSDWKLVFQVLFLSLCALSVLRALARTPGRNVAYGIAAVLAVFGVIKALGFDLIAGVMEHLIRLGSILLVILFREEARNLLGRVGRQSRKLLRLGESPTPTGTPRLVDDLTAALERLAIQRAGALVAIEREDALDEIAASGFEVHAVLSAPLLEAIFTSKSPMHDGAVIVRGQQIVAAGAVLPDAKGSRGGSRVGTRHRAALGLSESTDALVLVVSEERGTISAAQGGVLRPLNREHLRHEIHSLLHGGTLSDLREPPAPIHRFRDLAAPWLDRWKRRSGD